MFAAFTRAFRNRSRHDAPTQKILDEFSRQLDLVEKQVPMRDGYQRIDPYVREYNQGNISFRLIIYHRESQSWFDNDHVDAVLENASRFNLIQSGDTVFDLGCNSGFLTAWFAKRVGPTGRVLAFDPFPWNTLATLYSGKLNGCDNIQCHTVGIASRYGVVRIPVVDSKIYENQQLPDNLCFQAKLVPLDEYASFRPDFIKVDIEGAERELLAGARKILAQTPKPQWLFELHHDFIRAAGCDPDAICRELIDSGYTCRIGNARDGQPIDRSTVTPSGCGVYALRSQAA